MENLETVTRHEVGHGQYVEGRIFDGIPLPHKEAIIHWNNSICFLLMQTIPKAVAA